MLIQGPGLRPATRQRRAAPIKRAMDLVLGSAALVGALPFIAVSVVVVFAVDRHWPIYADTRIGLRGRPFRCLKLRTMRQDPRILDDYLAASPEESESYRVNRKLRFDPRVTAVGAFLRKWSVDELPQLLNVVKGDMSLVGPRPLSPSEFLARESGAGPLTLVRPGLTGSWQVGGRADTSNERRIALDAKYARHWTIWTDCKILLATPAAVLGARGAR